MTKSSDPAILSAKLDELHERANTCEKAGRHKEAETLRRRAADVVDELIDLGHDPDAPSPA